MTATEAMERTTGNERKASTSEGEAKSHDQRAPAAENAHRTPKKRRKVNHGELVAPCLPPPLLCVFPKLTRTAHSSQPVSTAVDL
jgi:hypothetical protein